ncbi:CorC/HlyC family transporter associated protein [gut metagenome]|uniref:CorC/HlyC family transporter associated protein n=1 Tax=gut metagenome TaxID=749906 RepID=J9GR68_9ZZZZ
MMGRRKVQEVAEDVAVEEEDGSGDIVTSAQKFSEETVVEVMIPRVDIVDLVYTASFNEVMACVVENNYSRIPVVDESRDKVKGILYVKDLLRYRHEGDDFNWQQLLRSPYFIPESKMIEDLLREFQRNKVHIAIVVDEYGSVSGMVTMEDILEEIVGEIQDEYDEETAFFEKAEDGSFTFEGKTGLDDFFETIAVDSRDYEEYIGDAETVAGFVLELMDEIPVVGQQVKCRSLNFQVVELQRQRISKIKVTLTHEENDSIAAGCWVSVA